MKHDRVPLFLFVLVLTTLVFTSARATAQDSSSKSHEEASGPMNTICPVSDEEVDERFSVEYQGKTIGLCCRKCKRKFEENPQAYIAKLSAFNFSSLPDQYAQQQELEAENNNESSDSQPDNPVSAASHSAPPDDHAHAGDTTDTHDENNHQAQESAHNHATDHEAKEHEWKLIAWLGNFHPPATHLPIGMLLGAAMAEGLFIVTRKDNFRFVVAFCVSVAAIGILATVTLGWFNGGFAIVDDDWAQTVHRWLGTTTAAMTLITFALLGKTSRQSVGSPSRTPFRIALLTTTTLILITGFFGGVLVYGLKHYGW